MQYNAPGSVAVWVTGKIKSKPCHGQGKILHANTARSGDVLTA
jgi:hypothetical protein